jgi:biotin carboxyl carrier protein
MKMNTYIYASAAGKVLSIHASVGDGVEEGALLVKLG